MKHGKGEFKWGSGGHYLGSYQLDQKDGFGEMKWADGSCYKGFWKNGVQNGLGMIEFANGIKKAGFFVENTLDELLTEHIQLDKYESQNGILGQDFKIQLQKLIKEQQNEQSGHFDSTQSIGDQVKSARYQEDRAQPNTLLLVQDPVLAPWKQVEGMSKD